MTKTQVEVITSVQRRRRWSRAEKERIVAAALAERGSITRPLSKVMPLTTVRITAAPTSAKPPRRPSQNRRASPTIPTRLGQRNDSYPSYSP
jgi:hypothetical protein